MKIIFPFIGCLLFGIAFASKSHPITTLINAKWFTTPVCLEIAEYLFDESPNLYWDYVNELNALKTPLHKIDSDSKAYKSSIAAAEKLIGPIQLSLLKLSLSMHSLSPRVQAHFRIAQEVIHHSDCKTNSFVTLGNRVACNLSELKKGLEKVQKDVSNGKTNNVDEEDDEEIYSFDHIYPGTENNTITCILYSQIGSKEFSTFHEYLTKEAEAGKIKYISRHYIRVSYSIMCFHF